MKLSVPPVKLSVPLGLLLPTYKTLGVLHNFSFVHINHLNCPMHLAHYCLMLIIHRFPIGLAAVVWVPQDKRRRLWR